MADGRRPAADHSDPNNEGECRQVRPVPMLRRSFEVTKPVSSARVYSSGLGYNDLQLNGRPADDRALDPVFPRTLHITKTLLRRGFRVSEAVHNMAPRYSIRTQSARPGMKDARREAGLSCDRGDTSAFATGFYAAVVPASRSINRARRTTPAGSSACSPLPGSNPDSAITVVTESAITISARSWTLASAG
jgi:hypothetical protein